MKALSLAREAGFKEHPNFSAEIFFARILTAPSLRSTDCAAPETTQGLVFHGEILDGGNRARAGGLR